MRRLLVGIAIAAILIADAATAAVGFGTRSTAGATDLLPRDRLHVVWSATSPPDLQQIQIVAGLVLIRTSSALVALNPSNGRRLWTATAADVPYSSDGAEPTTPFRTADAVWFAALGATPHSEQLVAVEASTGQRITAVPDYSGQAAPDGRGGALVAAKQLVDLSPAGLMRSATQRGSGPVLSIAVDGRSGMYVLGLAGHAEIGSLDGGVPASFSDQYVEQVGDGYAALAVSGVVEVVDLATRAVVQRHAVGDAETGFSVLASGVVLVDAGTTLRAYALDNGRALWSASGLQAGQVEAIGNTVVVGRSFGDATTMTGDTAGLSLTDGHVEWVRPECADPLPSTYDTRTTVLQCERGLSGVDAASGEVFWTKPLLPTQQTVLDDGNGQIVVADAERITAYG